MRTYELLHHIQHHRRGFFSQFTPDEKLLIKPILKAVEIKPNQALLFPQFLPHCLTDSTTSQDPNARANSFYIGLKMAEERSVLETVQSRLVDSFEEGGQHPYQRKYGRNGFTDGGINQEHREKLRTCLFKQYDIPEAVGGKGGISAAHPLPTLRQFVNDVKAARENPHAWPEGMDCQDLDIDSVLIPRGVLEHAMQILPL
jgi:hypothetical protein